MQYIYVYVYIYGKCNRLLLFGNTIDKKTISLLLLFCNCSWLRFLATIWPVPPVNTPPHTCPLPNEKSHKKVKRQRKMLNRSRFMNMQRLNNNNNWLTSNTHPTPPLSFSLCLFLYFPRFNSLSAKLFLKFKFFNEPKTENFPNKRLPNPLPPHPPQPLPG